jgi:hypothetical protein
MAEPQATRGTLLRWVILRALGVCALALLMIYLIDFCVLRFRLATNRNAYSTVQVRPFYAVPRKDHKIQFMFDDPRDETCVNSLFPHDGHDPCWYLRRNREKRIDL